MASISRLRSAWLRAEAASERQAQVSTRASLVAEANRAWQAAGAAEAEAEAVAEELSAVRVRAAELRDRYLRARAVADSEWTRLVEVGRELARTPAVLPSDPSSDSPLDS